MSHTLVDDVQNYIDECENNLSCALNDSVSELVENLQSAQSALGSIESELVYVNDELEEKEDLVNEYEAIGDVDELQEMKDILEEYQALGTIESLREAQTNPYEAEFDNIKRANELLSTINKRQSSLIKGARLALLTDVDTGLTQSQADYMEYLREGEPQDVVLARGVELKVSTLIESEWPVDGNGSPVAAS